MSRITTNKTVFETRMSILRHIAASHPRRVGSAELSEAIGGTLRSHQRSLQKLVALGYLECDGQNPAGYRIIKSEFKEFKGL